MTMLHVWLTFSLVDDCDCVNTNCTALSWSSRQPQLYRCGIYVITMIGINYVNLEHAVVLKHSYIKHTTNIQLHKCNNKSEIIFKMLL